MYKHQQRLHHLLTRIIYFLLISSLSFVVNQSYLLASVEETQVINELNNLEDLLDRIERLERELQAANGTIEELQKQLEARKTLQPKILIKSQKVLDVQ